MKSSQAAATSSVVEEESSVGNFFKKLLPPSFTHEKSNMRIYLDQKMTNDEPYLLFPSDNNTLIVRSLILMVCIEYRDIYRALPQVFNREYTYRGRT